MSHPIEAASTLAVFLALAVMTTLIPTPRQKPAEPAKVEVPEKVTPEPEPRPTPVLVPAQVPEVSAEQLRVNDLAAEVKETKTEIDEIKQLVRMKLASEGAKSGRD